MNRKITSFLLGVLLFLSIIFVIGNLPSGSSGNRKQINPGEFVTLVQNKKIKQVEFQQSYAELKDFDGNIFYVALGGDAMSEVLLKTVNDYNSTNENAPIKVTEAGASSGWGWILLVNNLFLLFAFISCLLIAFYLGTLSSKSKG